MSFFWMFSCKIHQIVFIFRVPGIEGHLSYRSCWRALDEISIGRCSHIELSLFSFLRSHFLSVPENTSTTQPIFICRKKAAERNVSHAKGWVSEEREEERKRKWEKERKREREEEKEHHCALVYSLSIWFMAIVHCTGRHHPAHLR